MMESKLDLSDIPAENLKCKICEKTFHSTEELDVHTDLYLGSFSHKCPDCTMTFKCRYDTSRHMMARHERELRDFENTHYIRCPQCVMTFRSCDGIIRHTKAAHEVDIDDEEGVPKIHFPRLHGDESPQNLSMAKSNRVELQGGLNHKCPDCTMTFESRDETNMHMVERHNRELQTSENTLYLRCPKCVMTFKSQDRVNRHAEAAHNTDLSDEEHVNESIPEVPHDDENEDEQHELCPKDSSKHKIVGDFKCHICEKILKSAKGLRVHVDRHRGILGHKCPECDMTFKCRYDTNRHMVGRHNRELGPNENTHRVESFAFVDADDEDDDGRDGCISRVYPKLCHMSSISTPNATDFWKHLEK